MTLERINFELDPDLKSRVVDLAKAQDLSVSQFVRRLIRQAVNQVEMSAPATARDDGKDTPQVQPANS